MKLPFASTLVAILFFLTTAGCAPAPIIPMGVDTYTISQTSAGGMFKSMSSLRGEVLGRVNEFAQSKGMIAVSVTENESPAWPGHMPSFTYTFRLVSSTALTPSTGNIVGNQSEFNEAYDSLLKLDDLRNKGILTQAEFEAKKAKILSGK